MSLEAEITELARRVRSTRATAPLLPHELDQIIVELERTHKLVFPPELVQWWRMCNEGAIEPVRMPAIAPIKGRQKISWYLETWREWVARGWFPLTTDGCGDYYVLDVTSCAGRTHPVLFIDQCDYNKAVYVVASSLFRFLHFFFTDEALLDVGISGYWPFSKDRVIAEDPDIVLCSTAPLPWEVDEETRGE